MQTIADLKRQADQALFEERFGAALQLYATIVALQPASLDARLRVADALMALGELQRAAVVYTALSRHAALAGYPLRALVALKMLSALDPRLSVLLQDIAKLYARNSARVGRSVRRSLPSLDQPIAQLPAGPAHNDLPSWTAHAEALAKHYSEGELIYPDKLMPIPLLSLLPEAEFASVLDVLRVVRVRRDTVLVREGDPGRSFFVLARGSVRVVATRDGQQTRLAELAAGAIFGEMALLADSPRTASVIAQSDCDLLEFDCDALGAASATTSSLAHALGGFARERLLSNVASTSALFRPLDAQQRADLLRRFVSADAASGQRIINAGDPGAGLYVVLRGEVVVSRDEADGHVELARLGPSEVFGEISLITHEPATATVTATEQGASLLFLSRDYFERLVAAVPELQRYFERLAEERLLDLRLLCDEPIANDAEIEVEVLL
jgi:CRP-like cAMP-binding protein